MPVHVTIGDDVLDAAHARVVEIIKGDDRRLLLNLLAAIEARRVMIRGRLLELRQTRKRNRLLTVKEASVASGIRARWFYDHHCELDFVRRISPRRIMLEQDGLQRWMESRALKGVLLAVALMVAC